MPPAVNQPLVSVVTPVYNGETYLEECIQSVVNQTYDNFEYIIVNNCSTDRSLEIAQAYAAKDPRVRVVDNTDFLTALQNFNNAMRQISPESAYCKVVHADDWLFPECLEKMVALAEAHPSIGMVGSYRLVNNRVESDGLPYQCTLIPGVEMARMNLMDGPYTFGSPTALLLRSDLVRVRDPFYNEAHSGADTEACLELLQHCDFGFVHQVLTFYRIHEGAITGKNMDIQTGYPNFLYSFKKYGPVFLSSQDYEKRHKELKKRYYRFLGGRILRWRDKRFWEYHRAAIRDHLKEEFLWGELAKGALYVGAKKLLDLKGHVTWLHHRILCQTDH